MPTSKGSPIAHEPGAHEPGAHQPVVGLDVGGTKILGLLVDGSDRVLAEERVPTPSDGPNLLDALVAVTRSLLAAAEGEGSGGSGPPSAVGVGMMGLIDRAGTMCFAPHLPGVVELPVGPHLEAAVGLPVVMDNDATCAMRGEHALGAARGARDALLVTLGTGVGSGVLLGGEIVRGANGFAGEAGHMVVDPDGVACPCGRRGCWERYASGAGLGRSGREAAEAGRARRLVELAGGDPLAVRGEHVTTAADEGDPVALELVEEFAGWTGLGLVNLVQLLDVSLIVIGGGLAESAGVLLEPIRRAFANRQVATAYRPPVTIAAAELGERAGAIGAAQLARPHDSRGATQPGRSQHRQ